MAYLTHHMWLLLRPKFGRQSQFERYFAVGRLR